MGQKWGLCPFLRGGDAGSLSNTMWPGPRPTFVPSGILIHPVVWPQQTWADNWGGGCAPWGGDGSASNTVLPGPSTTFVPSGILIHPDVWPQQTLAENWGLCPFLGELGPNLAQCGLGRDLPPYQVASWSIQPFSHNIYGPKIGRLCPFGGGSWFSIQHNVARAEA